MDEHSYEMQDDDAYEGPDADIDDDDEIEDEIDGIEEWAQPQDDRSVQGLLQTLFAMQNGERDPRQASLRLSQELSRLLASSSASFVQSRLVQTREGDSDEDNVDDEAYYRGERKHILWFKPHTEPQEAGTQLLMGGEYGRVRDRIGSLRRNVNIAKLLRDRASQARPSVYKEDIANHLVPNTNGTAVATSDANIYCGQYSADSSFYYTCSQDFELRVYDTTSPPQSNAPQTLDRSGQRLVSPSKMKIIKSMTGNPGRWTITDSHLSPDNERMIYSSITPTIYLTSTLDSSSSQIPIRFADPPPNGSRTIWGFHEESFGIWSCRFSADGNEVVAGGSEKIFVYDLLANRRTVKISAHDDDVNSCCWADTASGNVLVSASDDSFIKIWDRRSLGSSQKPSGVLVGHTEGITNVAAKGDGRYIISNGKDQALRLWDLRKMHSSTEFDKFEDRFYGMRHYDYRDAYYPRPKVSAHPKDCSVMTYRGHQVLQTLIRCNFSPAETTGSQYLYSGSSDGKIHIWSLDGRVVQVLNRSKSQPMAIDASGPEVELHSGSRNRVCVRDVSWHSQEPVLLSVGWENARGGSTVARHEWKGLSKFPHFKLEDWNEKETEESTERGRGRERVPGSFTDESDYSE